MTPTLADRLKEVLKFDGHKFQEYADRIDLREWLALPKSSAANCVRHNLTTLSPIHSALIDVVSAVEIIHATHAITDTEKLISKKAFDVLYSLERALKQVEGGDV